ncbi:hypothetical protein E1A91_A13G247200v1 [Gossypium mustelinum]|uniref:Uncharacterized protein n=1 Tax=Gossypium mustelinum TaxID=34275 RepID=A0A5D2WLY8_GOSMU|nr:hypothetical protein E1A91_A13G247200v1 [Gossypium mustelinum]
MLSKMVPVPCIKVADLGCATGPNTFFPTCEIVDIVTRICQEAHCESPELQVFLNDLPQNDFNTVFKSVPSFNGRPCFIAGVAGSFYQRLFPTNSIHFVHSSYSLHWLSKVPGEVENKRNVYIAKSNPPNVSKAYFEQIRNDFSSFLRFRFEEMITGGRMLLTFVGRSITDPTSKDCCAIWGLFTKSLLDLMAEGLVCESDVDSFNVPYYHPCKEEVREIIETEGSFALNELETFKINWDFEDDICNENFVFENSKSGRNVANCIRAITESLIVSHFEDTIIDNLFSRYAQHVGEHLSYEKTKMVTIVVSITIK